MNISYKLTAIAAFILASLALVASFVLQSEHETESINRSYVSDVSELEHKNTPQNAQTAAPVAWSNQTSSVERDTSVPPMTGDNWKQQLPTQFQDTDVTGSLRVDEQGNFIADDQARQVFDYFLTAQDDANIEQIRDWIHAYINENLTAPANQQALAVLDNYITYKSQLNTLSVDDGVWERLYDPSQAVTQGDLKSLSEVFRDRQGLQAELFDQETQQALFGVDNQYDDYMLQRLEITVSGQPQAVINEQLSQLDKQQSPETVKNRTESQIAINHKDLNQSLDQADSAYKYQVYSQTYGDEAADRLMALQEKRQVFSEKRDRYLAFKSTVGNDASGSLEDYMKYELALTDGEIKRMQTLDKLDASKLN